MEYEGGADEIGDLVSALNTALSAIQDRQRAEREFLLEVSHELAAPLTVVGPVGTAAVVDSLLAALGPDTCYRTEHHDDLEGPPPVEVVEVSDGEVAVAGEAKVTCAPTDHRPVQPTVGYRFDHDGMIVELWQQPDLDALDQHLRSWDVAGGGGAVSP